MAKNVSSIKKTQTGTSKLIKRCAAVLISILTLVFATAYLNNIDSAARDTIAVVRIKQTDIPAFAVISEENVEKYDMIIREYNNAVGDIVLWEEFEDIIKGEDLVASYYLRGATPLYRDQLIQERPKRNEWLYELDNEYEVVTIPYNSLEAGGDVLLPGDRVRIRVTYEVQEGSYEHDAYSENDERYFLMDKSIMRTDIVFDSVVIKDMINSKGQSIYEVYNEVRKLDERTRQEVMKSSDFIASIKPKSLVLEGSADDMEKYARYRMMARDDAFLITILARGPNSAIIDLLPTLESEVRSWLPE